MTKIELKNIEDELDFIRDVPGYIENYEFPGIIEQIRIKLRQKGKR